MTTSRLEAAAQAAIFIAFLGLPLADSALDLDRSTPPPGAEEAPRPQRPDSLATLAAFPESFDPYFRAHFGWRKWLINRFHQLNYLVFRVSESPSVHVGRDGWLYYGGTATDYQRADKPFTPRQRQRWLDSITQRRDWLAAQGIEYLLVVAPNKHSIYPEHLPAKLTRSGKQSRWEVLAGLLRDTEVEVVDLHTPLRAAKERELVYERTGSHWNQRGAYLAYRELFAQLDARFPGQAPVAWEQVEWADRPAADLLNLISLTELVHEPRHLPVGGLRYVDLEFKRNAGLVTEQDDAALPRAVIFHDSFAVSLAPYLAEHFSYAVFQWRARFDGKLVQRVKPDIVIEQRVERRLQLGPIPNVLPRLDEARERQ